MADIARVRFTTREVTKGLTLVLRLPRCFAIRTRIACWLIGLAGRVINVPCEIEMCRDTGCKADCRFCKADAQG